MMIHPKHIYQNIFILILIVLLLAGGIMFFTQQPHEETESEQDEMPNHENIRGEDYYQ